MRQLARRTKALYRKVRNRYLGMKNPIRLAGILYSETMGNGKTINWENPIDINEKINWLKFHSDTTQWSKLADKYAVRDFIEERVGKQYLVPLLGVWKNSSEIDFAKLPESFVLKTNNGAGSVIVVKDKKCIDEFQIKKQLDKWLKMDFGIEHAEPHYSKINPLIIAEEILQEVNPISSSLIDYKIWCFNGKIFGIWCCFNRVGFHADTEWHDVEWNFRPEWSIFTPSYRNGGGKVSKPKNYEKMLEIASKLSQGFPEVRVDMYNINGKIYFGEMTFTCAGGHINFYTDQVLEKMGEMTMIK